VQLAEGELQVRCQHATRQQLVPGLAVDAGEHLLLLQSEHQALVVGAAADDVAAAGGVAPAGGGLRHEQSERSNRCGQGNQDLAHAGLLRGRRGGSGVGGSQTPEGAATKKGT
jgi:hypothetical protein